MKSIVLSLMAMFFYFPNVDAQQKSKTFAHLSLCFDSSQKPKFCYYLFSKKKVSIFTNQKISTDCPEWFIDIVFYFNVFDTLKNKYQQRECKLDLQPVFKPDGTFGEMTTIENMRSQLFYIEFEPKRDIPGDYRLNIRFYYYQEGKRKFVESNSIYFRID